MRHRLSVILHFSLLFAVLLSSTGFRIDRHYCGGKVKAVAVFVKADRCKGCRHEEQPGSSADGACDATASLTKKKCCHDQWSFHKLVQVQKTDRAVVLPAVESLPVAVLPVFNPVIPVSICSLSSFLAYRPPPRLRVDAQARLQVFRI